MCASNNLRARWAGSLMILLIYKQTNKLLLDALSSKSYVYACKQFMNFADTQTNYCKMGGFDELVDTQK